MELIEEVRSSDFSVLQLMLDSEYKFGLRSGLESADVKVKKLELEINKSKLIICNLTQERFILKAQLEDTKKHLQATMAMNDSSFKFSKSLNFAPEPHFCSLSTRASVQISSNEYESDNN